MQWISPAVDFFAVTLVSFEHGNEITLLPMKIAVRMTPLVFGLRQSHGKVADVESVYNAVKCFSRLEFGESLCFAVQNVDSRSRELKLSGVVESRYFNSPQSRFGTFYCINEGQNKTERSDGCEDDLRQCGYLLPFSGGGASVGGISSLALGLQIFGLALIGFLLAIPGSFGLYWIFDNPNRNRKFLGAGLAATFLPCTLFFYGWAFSAHPFATWGLC